MAAFPERRRVRRAADRGGEGDGDDSRGGEGRGT